jgi:uncharacterized protein (TIGR03437 family)
MYFENRRISWTAVSFQPGFLIADFDDYQPTRLDRVWSCGEISAPQAGMGELLVYLMTGDPGGFGNLMTDYIANAAGGPAGPVAPGELLALYIEQMGPSSGALATTGDDDRLPTNLAGTEVRFDGIPAPALYSGDFQINVQVPYSLQPDTMTTVQVFYQGVPSNRAVVPVAEASPELFSDGVTRAVIALNQDGSRNTPSNPAARGTVVVLFASGGGQTSPPGITGKRAPSPHPVLNGPVDVNIDGAAAEVLFAGEVPGFVGLVQINARLQDGPVHAPRAVPVTLRIGARTNRAPVSLWVR